jgi:putative oxidoreductase
METTAKDLALVLPRLSLGATMLHHGTQKLGAQGRAQTAQFLEQIGYRPGARWATWLGAAETFAGASVILGAATRLAALAVIVTQSVAVAKVHARKGFDIMAGGWEFNALIIATALGVLLAGPGTISVHELVERRLEGGARWLFSPRRRRAVALTKLLR